MEDIKFRGRAERCLRMGWTGRAPAPNRSENVRGLRSTRSTSLCPIRQPLVTRKNEIRAYLWAVNESRRKRVSEVGLMSGKYPLSFLRRIERQWAERIPSLEQIHGQIVVAVKRKLQRVLTMRFR